MFGQLSSIEIRPRRNRLQSKPGHTDLINFCPWLANRCPATFATLPWFAPVILDSFRHTNSILMHLTGQSPWPGLLANGDWVHGLAAN